MQVVLAVTSDTSLDNDASYGHLKLVSHSEGIHTLLLSIALNIQQGGDEGSWEEVSLQARFFPRPSHFASSWGGPTLWGS